MINLSPELLAKIPLETIVESLNARGMAFIGISRESIAKIAKKSFDLDLTDDQAMLICAQISFYFNTVSLTRASNIIAGRLRELKKELKADA